MIRSPNKKIKLIKCPSCHQDCLTHQACLQCVSCKITYHEKFAMKNQALLLYMYKVYTEAILEKFQTRILQQERELERLRNLQATTSSQQTGPLGKRSRRDSVETVNEDIRIDTDLIMRNMNKAMATLTQSYSIIPFKS